VRPETELAPGPGPAQVAGCRRECDVEESLAARGVANRVRLARGDRGRKGVGQRRAPVRDECRIARREAKPRGRVDGADADLLAGGDPDTRQRVVERLVERTAEQRIEPAPRVELRLRQAVVRAHGPDPPRLDRHPTLPGASPTRMPLCGRPTIPVRPSSPPTCTSSQLLVRPMIDSRPTCRPYPTRMPLPTVHSS